jgi:hypothetical protein
LTKLLTAPVAVFGIANLPGFVDFHMGKIDVFRCCGQLPFVEKMLVCAAPIYFAPFLRRVVFVAEALCVRFSRGRRTCGRKVGLCEFV